MKGVGSESHSAGLDADDDFDHGVDGRDDHDDRQTRRLTASMAALEHKQSNADGNEQVIPGHNIVADRWAGGFQPPYTPQPPPATTPWPTPPLQSDTQVSTSVSVKR